MPISTSGLTVPQIGQQFDTSMYGNAIPTKQELPKGMTIGDMLDLSKKSLELKKAKETYQPEVETARATARKANTEASKAQFGFTNEQGIAAQNEAGRLLIDPRIKNAENTPKGRENALRALDEVADTLKNKGLHDDVIKGMLGQYYTQAIHDPTQISPKITQGLLASSGQENQINKMFPATQQANIGGQDVTIGTGNPDIAVNAPGVPTGPYLQKSLAPQVSTSPTGGPMLFGGGGTPQAGNLNNRPVGVQVAPAGGGATATGMQQNAPQANAPQSGGVTSQTMSQPKGGSAIPYVPGEPYDAFKVRAGDVAKMPRAASEALNINNADSIPNARYTNEKIQKMLDNPNLNIGPIADAIAKQTGGIGLSADQQEIMKYLEQRIRMESARTNQDQTSQRTAFGSFGTQKNALREILYKDNGNLAGQELYQRGILNHAGDINRPNLQSVNQFNNDYAKLAEPRVVHLIGVIGDKSTKDLTKADRQHLAKEFSGLSDNQIQELMNKRQKLLDLVGK